MQTHLPWKGSQEVRVDRAQCAGTSGKGESHGTKRWQIMHSLVLVATAQTWQHTGEFALIYLSLPISSFLQLPSFLSLTRQRPFSVNLPACAFLKNLFTKGKVSLISNALPFDLEWGSYPEYPTLEIQPCSALLLVAPLFMGWGSQAVKVLAHPDLSPSF